MITITNLSFSYKKKSILKELSFEVNKGTCVGIVGANGSGKSTLLAILAGVLKPLSGSVQYDQQNIHALRHTLLQYVGYVPQNNPLIEDLNVLDNLRLWYQGRTSSLRKELQRDLLAQLSLEESLHTRVNQLSGGMKKRVSLAIALLNHPQILLLDEPSAALDLVCKQDIHTYLTLYLAQGGTVILTTHEESELDLCDVLYVLKQGKLHSISPSLRGEALVQQL